MTRETAAARSSALLRQLDAGRQQRDDLRHAPACDHPDLTTEQGYSVTIRRCPSCGAVTTTRNTPTQPKPKGTK